MTDETKASTSSTRKVEPSSPDIDIAPTQLTIEELAQYSAKGDRADAAIAKYIDKIASPNQNFKLVTNNLKDFDGRGNFKVPDRV